MSETRRYTADELHGDLYYALPDGAEFVAASDYDDLLAELNRVKAESLRVVPNGGQREWYRVTGWPHLYFLHDRKLHLFFGGTFYDQNNNELAGPLDPEFVQPVRLEQWNTTP